MKTIPLPGTPFAVSTLGFGATGLGTANKGDDAVRLVAEYVEAGGNFFDTAHNYGFWVKDSLGASERELGRVLRHLRLGDRVLVATKGGHSEAGPGYRRPEDFLAQNVLLCDIENSLYRLGVETIDLYYLHRDDGTTPVGEIIERLNGFIQRGWLRYLGASNWSVERIAAANAYAAEKGLQGFAISQIQGSLAASSHAPTADPTHRYLDAPTAEWHRRTGMPVAAFSATANGYFSESPGHLAEPFFGNLTSQARRERARQLAAELGCTSTQIAVAYLLCQPGLPLIALFSTSRPDHLAEILRSAEIALTDTQLKWLRDG
jgi:aryl-alcohol dehydrogenase-like predicted oxidoreductase